MFLAVKDLIRSSGSEYVPPRLGIVDLKSSLSITNPSEDILIVILHLYIGALVPYSDGEDRKFDNVMDSESLLRWQIEYKW